MDLNKAFIDAAKKFYEGYSFESTTKHLGTNFQYSFSKLNELQSGVKPKKSKESTDVQLEE